MRALKIAVLSLPVALLIGCASGPATLGTCDNSGTVCPPIVIYPIVKGGYSAQPDRLWFMAGTRVLVWSFGDASAGNNPQRVFDTNFYPSKVRDGVEFISITNGSVVGIDPCFATDDPAGAPPVAAIGRFYRCKVKSTAPQFSIDYRIRFHEGATQQTIDPTITHTGSGVALIEQVSGGPPLVYAPAPVVAAAAPRKVTPSTKTDAAVRAKLLGTAGSADPAELVVPKSMDTEITIVTWLPPDSSYEFDTLQPQPDGLADTGGLACGATATADISDDLDKAAYFSCAVLNTWTGPLSYTIQYRKGTSVIKATGVLKR
jgi:hypothetical protein